MSVPNYKKKYLDEVRPHLMKKFDFSSIMQVPKIEKITLNIGIGNAKDNKKALQSALEELMLITGQKPVVTTAKRIFQISRSEKVFQLVVKLHLEKTLCTSFWKDYVQLHYLELEISEVYLLNLLMEWVIIALELKNKLFLLR